MYLCIDFGGTKTLLCVLSDTGEITHEVRFETPADYPDFIDRLVAEITTLPEQFTTGVMSVPGKINRNEGTIIALGNRPWTDCALRADILERTGVHLELMNDAQLAGLAEATQLREQYRRTMYVTVSTGINIALAVDGALLPELHDVEFGKIPLHVDGAYVNWEDIASGRAIVATYNQRASDITDPEIWRQIAQKLVLGLGPACAAFQPEAIVFGGGAGMHADKFIPDVREELEQILHPVISRPQAYIATHFKDEGVIFGCYFYAKGRR